MAQYSSEVLAQSLKASYDPSLPSRVYRSLRRISLPAAKHRPFSTKQNLVSITTHAHDQLPATAAHRRKRVSFSNVNEVFLIPGVERTERSAERHPSKLESSSARSRRRSSSDATSPSHSSKNYPFPPSPRRPSIPSLLPATGRDRYGSHSSVSAHRIQPHNLDCRCHYCFKHQAPLLSEWIAVYMNEVTRSTLNSFGGRPLRSQRYSILNMLASLEAKPYMIPFSLFYTFLLVSDTAINQHSHWQQRESPELQEKLFLLSLLLSAKHWNSHSYEKAADVWHSFFPRATSYERLEAVALCILGHNLDLQGAECYDWMSYLRVRILDSSPCSSEAEGTALRLIEELSYGMMPHRWSRETQDAFDRVLTNPRRNLWSYDHLCLQLELLTLLAEDSTPAMQERHSPATRTHEPTRERRRSASLRATNSEESSNRRSDVPGKKATTQRVEPRSRRRASGIYAS